MGKGLYFWLALSVATLAGCKTDKPIQDQTDNVTGLDPMDDVCRGEISADEYREVRLILALYPSTRKLIRDSLKSGNQIDRCELGSIRGAVSDADIALLKRKLEREAR